jgi:hypothetical protein
MGKYSYSAGSLEALERYLRVQEYLMCLELQRSRSNSQNGRPDKQEKGSRSPSGKSNDLDRAKK